MTASSSADNDYGSTTSARTSRRQQAAEPQAAWQSQALAHQASKQQGFAPGASNVQSSHCEVCRNTLSTLSHCVRALPQSHTAKMVTKKRERSPSTTPMPTTEAAQNDGSHLTAAQWEGMQKVLNHIYDYRTEEYVDMYPLARDGTLTFR